MPDRQLLSMIFAAVVVAAALLVAWLLRRRRRLTWRAFADRHELRPAAVEGAITEFAGTVQGRAVSLRQATRGSDTDTLGVTVLTLTASLSGDLPLALRIEPGTPLDPILMPEDEDGGAEIVTTGDDDFDDRVRVRARAPEAARAYLTSARKQAILRLVEEYPSAASGLRGRQVRVAMREVIARAERLQECLDLLLAVAPVLDGDAVTPPGASRSEGTAG